MYPDKDKHSEGDKKNPSMIGSRGNRLRPACHSIGDGYFQGRTSGKNSDEQSLTSQVDFGWTLWKTQKTATFSQKAENYLLDVCWTREETSKATASNVTSQISSLRDDLPVDTAANRSILQPLICRNKNWFIDEAPLCKYE